MGFVLVCPLMLAFLPIGLSFTEATVRRDNTKCYVQCPAGFYSVGPCDGGQMFHCERCANGSTFTDIENTVGKCERCTMCDVSRGQKVTQACSYNSDTICTCKEGFFNSRALPKLDCLRCYPSRNLVSFPDNKEYMKICRPCQSEDCERDSECRKNCATTPSTTTTTSTTPTTTTTTPTTTTTTPTTTTTAPTTTTTAPTTTTTASATVTNSANPDSVVGPHLNNIVNSSSVLTLLVVVVTVLLLLVILVVLTRHPECCLCWTTDKDLDHQFKEQHSDQHGSPTTLTLNICEETHTLSYCPVTTEHPTHISPLLLDAKKKAAREEEPSGQWPAIVLYAIIKEVPLRRWKEFLRLLSVADQDLERVELEAGLGLGLMEKQYVMLRLWSQRTSATLDEVYSALRYMDLSGCAQLLQERLEKLQ